MLQTDCCVGFVDVLAPLAAGAVGSDFTLFKEFIVGCREVDLRAFHIRGSAKGTMAEAPLCTMEKIRCRTLVRNHYRLCFE